MKLHLDPETFQTLLLDVAEKKSLRADIIEKDYYISLMLKELSEKQKDLPVYFKGGTALYKALRSIKRFSEDIDLTVAIEDCSNTQAKKRLENAANGYTSLIRNKDDKDNENRKGSITSIYYYNSVVSIDKDDELQRFGRIKIEATSFTISEPYESMQISPIIYDFASNEQKQILDEIYEVSEFNINTITLERIFVDKIFAAEFYFRRDEYFDVAKHIYDITELSRHEKIMDLCNNPLLLKHLIGLKRKEESNRIGSELADKDITDFVYFVKAFGEERFIREFQRMQSVYVFNKKDIITPKEAEEALNYINRKIVENLNIKVIENDQNLEI